MLLTSNAHTAGILQSPLYVLTAGMAESAPRAVIHHIRTSQRSQATAPTLRVPVTASVNTLREAEGRLFRPRNDVGAALRNRTQASRAGIFLGRAGKTTHLIVQPVRSSLRTRHGGEALHL